MALVALVVTARADDEKKKKVEPPAPDSYKSLTTEFSKTRRKLSTAFRAAKNEKERDKILEDYNLAGSKIAIRFLEFAKANADDPIAYDALVWVVSNDSQGDVAEKVIPIIVAKHLNNPKIVQMCQQLRRSTSPAAKKLLQVVIDSSKNVDAQAHATYSLAKALLGRTGEKNEKAEVLLARVVKDYKSVANGSLAKMAERDLFVAQHLSIGCEAPEITSEDIDGVEFSLADYRGKVVVLDFWGNW
jgi:hypothetical protein